MTRFHQLSTALMVFSALWLAGCGQAPKISHSTGLEDWIGSKGLTFERALANGPNYSAYLISYRSAGLKVYAMVAVPNSVSPPKGFPILLANHGYHPDPPKYGFTSSGLDSRPGDYYRVVPEKYAESGFVVVMPDYRGHNVSEGKEFTKLPESTAFYRDDVLALFPLLATLEKVDARNVFMWGHSMGSVVTVKALPATPTLRGATIWSTARLAEAQLAELKSVDIPVLIHHAKGDKTTSIEWSEKAAGTLAAMGKLENFFIYGVDDHFFKSPQLDLAVERDITFFRKRLVK